MGKADNASVMRATRPLFRFDPGWLFIIAGLAVCAAGVLLPAQADLRALEEQLAVLQGEEARAYQRLAAHADFIDQVDRGDPGIIKRLAAAQLNLVPEGDKPVLLAGGDTSPVTEWIDATVDLNLRPPPIEPVSTLSRWANGTSRLWMFGGGIMSVFIGLLISPDGSRSRRRALTAASRDFDAWSATGDWSSSAVAPASRDDEPECSEHAVRAVENDAAYGILDELRSCASEAHASLPATADLDPETDLRQQEDTVDLEEDELPARSRSVIDDNVAWHDAATAEHAREVIIDAKEVKPGSAESSSSSSTELLPWNEHSVAADEPSGPSSTSPSDVPQNNLIELDADTEVADENAWTIADAVRLSEVSLLLPTSDAPESTSEATSEAAASEGDEAPQSTRKRRRKRERHVEVKDVEEALDEPEAPVAADDDSVPTSDPLPESLPPRKPKRQTPPARKRSARNDEDSSSSIPFLRYRAAADDDESDDNANVVIDDDLPAMAADEGDDAAFETTDAGHEVSENDEE